MKTSRTRVRRQLTRLALQPTPAPRPLFAQQLEERLLGLADGEVVATTASVHRMPKRWIAGVVAAAAAVAGVLAVHPGAQPNRSVTHVGSRGDEAAVSTTAPTTPATTTATTRPAPPSSTTTERKPTTTTVATPTTAVPPAPVVVVVTTTSTTARPATTTTTTATATTARPVETTTTSAAPTTTTSTTASGRSPSLGCFPGLAASPSVSCSWSKTTSANVAAYRLQRGTADLPLAPVFKTTDLTTTTFVDNTAVNGTGYRYQLDVLDSSGAVIVSSNVATLTCCNAK